MHERARSLASIVCIVALLAGPLSAVRASADEHAREVHDRLTELIAAHQQAIEQHRDALAALEDAKAKVEAAMAEGRPLTEEEDIAVGKAVDQGVFADHGILGDGDFQPPD